MKRKRFTIKNYEKKKKKKKREEKKINAERGWWVYGISKKKGMV